MARSWHSRAVRLFTSATACQTLSTGVLTLSCCTWFCCWRASIAGACPRAILARACSIFFAAILTPICGKWASGIWPFPNECGSLPKRFMEDRPPISPLSMRRTAESLRRRWRVISFGGVDGAGPRRLGRYARAVARQFEVLDQEALLRGAVVFPDPEAVPMPQHQAPESAAPASTTPASSTPWHVPLTAEEVPETGQHFDLAADAHVRAAVAKAAGLRELPRFEASFDVTRRGGGLHVVGSISATVGQNCVVTLEPLANEVEETIDLIFEPPHGLPESADNEGQQHGVKWDDPEPLVGGAVDLGALATEFLLLGLDPYPRKPGAVFEPPQDAKTDEGPFAALGRLAKHQD